MIYSSVFGLITELKNNRIVASLAKVSSEVSNRNKNENLQYHKKSGPIRMNNKFTEY